jgi:hypothetical protein
MPKKPKPGPAAPDGSPKPRADRERTRKSKVSRVEDPLISGDAKPETSRNADEVAVDEAGQIRKKPAPVDLLH